MSDLLVSMILKLVDQASPGLRAVAGEVNQLDQALNKPANGQKIKASDWVEQQNAIRKSREEADAYQKSLGSVTDQFWKLSMAAQGFRDLARLGSEIAKPVSEATDRFAEFERLQEALARGAGQNNRKEEFGRSAMDIAQQTGVKWEDITAGRRAFVELGGGEGLDAIKSEEKRLAVLAQASGAKMEDLYKVLYSYMDVAKLTSKQAVDALEQNYRQGKTGAYELQNMVHGMPSLLAIGRSMGMTGDQLTQDLPAFLQVLRKVTGSAGEADTLLRHAMGKLANPQAQAKVEEELGINISQVMKDAKAKGLNPLMAALEAIAEKSKGDAEVLGAIARDEYFRRALQGYAQLKDEIENYKPTHEEAQSTVMEDFGSRTSTAAASAERLAIALDKAAIAAGATQAELRKGVQSVETKAANSAGDFATDHNIISGIATGIVNVGGRVIEGLGGLGNAIITGAIATKGIAWGWNKFRGGGSPAPELPGAVPETSAAINPLKGAPEVPASGGLSPGATAAIEGVTSTITRGLIAGALTWAGDWGEKKLFQAMPHPQFPPGYDPEDHGVISTAKRLWGDLTGGPKVDTSAIDEAKTKATEAGDQIKAALNITVKPDADASSVRELNVELRTSVGLLSQINGGISQASRAGAAIGKQLGALRKSSGALHDGVETEGR